MSRKSILFVVILLASACSSDPIARFFEGRYSLPDILFQVDDEGGRYVRTSTERPVFLVWFSREDCSECAVSHLEEKFYYLKRLADQTGLFDVLFVMSPKDGEIDHISEMISAYEFSWPVYLDPSNECEILLPEDSRFHMFLMDTSGKPVWLGSPLKDGTINDQFYAAINSLK